ncbi:hypothetical protein SLA2020_241140 [Shorea laevis]
MGKEEERRGGGGVAGMADGVIHHAEEAPRHRGFNDGSASYAALEKEAELYEKLVRGELPDEEDKGRYCVDFFRKGVRQEESQQSQAQHASPTEPLDEDGDNDTSFLFNTKFPGALRTDGVVDRDEHKHFVREVHEEANQAREKDQRLIHWAMESFLPMVNNYYPGTMQNSQHPAHVPSTVGPGCFRVTVGIEDVGAIAPSPMESAGVANGVPVTFPAVMACIVAWLF